MKTLSLSKPLLLLIVGLPGAGKSFFARQFSETFGAPIVSIDRLRFELFNEPTYNNEQNEILDRLATYQMEELVKTSRSFLLDGMCNMRTERQKLQQFASKHGYDTMTIWVQTDPTTAQLRSAHRNKRKTDDRYNQSLQPSTYTQLAKQFTPPTAREPYVVISGKHTYSTQAKMVLRKLTEPRASQADAAYNKDVKVVRPTPPPARPEPSPRRSVIIR